MKFWNCDNCIKLLKIFSSGEIENCNSKIYHKIIEMILFNPFKTKYFSGIYV